MAFTKILSLLFKDLRTIMGFFQWHFYVLSRLAVLRALCIATQPKHLLNKYQPVQCVILLLIKNQFIRRGLVHFRVVIPLSLNDRSLAFSCMYIAIDSFILSGGIWRRLWYCKQKPDEHYRTESMLDEFGEWKKALSQRRLPVYQHGIGYKPITIHG